MNTPARRPVTGGTFGGGSPPVEALRNKLAKNVATWSIRSGQPHGVIHNELRKICGGPAVAQASAEQIQARIDKLRTGSWADARTWIERKEKPRGCVCARGAFVCIKCRNIWV